MIHVLVEKSVTVIIPTIGQPSLTKAIKTCNPWYQTYKNIHNLVVVDGPKYYDAAVKQIAKSDCEVKLTSTPYNTGGNGFYGHRIYAAYPHLINTDYVAFLDEDNWWDEHHLGSMIELLERNNHDWVHSLRKVVLEDGKYLDDDCCESIGRWPIWFSPEDNPQHLVDTSSYLFKTDFLIKVCNHWHSGWGGDRRFFHIITKVMGHDNYGTTGLHTLNYKLPNMEKAYGGDYEFFKKGNEAIKQKYGSYPWLKT